MLTNNPSESLNKFIMAARYKPIISIFETIRKQVMLGIQEKKEKISLWNGVLCPRIKGKEKVVEEMCKTCEVSFAGDGKELANFFPSFALTIILRCLTFVVIGIIRQICS